MFGTLVIVLPGEFEGGELLIRHKGETAALTLHPDDPTQACFAAFYAESDVIWRIGEKIEEVLELPQEQGENRD